MRTITRAFTVIATPDHLRAAETIDRPVSILFDDPVLGDCPAELRLNREEALALIGSLTAALGRI
jgi:hypothetical protein